MNITIASLITTFARSGIVAERVSPENPPSASGIGTVVVNRYTPRSCDAPSYACNVVGRHDEHVRRLSPDTEYSESPSPLVFP